MKEKPVENSFEDMENWPPYTYRDYPNVTPETLRAFISFLRTENTRHLKMELQPWVSFCDSKCSFCYFPNETFRKEMIPDYLLALKKELKMYAGMPYIKTSEFDEVVLGGGSPSILSSEQIIDLIDYCEKNFNITNDQMIKVAGCTHNFDKEKLKAVADYSRRMNARCAQIDFGLQTFDDKIRKILNIRDSGEEAERIIKTARELGLYVCIDMMFNLPGQTIEGLRKDIRRALNLEVEGVDCYPLEVCPGTMLEKQIQQGKVPPPAGRSVEAQMNVEVYDIFEKAGYRPTGHSRFSRVVEHFTESCCAGWPWAGQLTTGSGCFMGYFEKFSYMNIGPAEAYIDAVNKGIFPIAKLSTASEEEEMKKVMTRLYVRQKVDKHQFKEEFGKTPEEAFPTEINSLKQKGLIEVDEDEIRLTRKGDLWRYNIAWEFGPKEKTCCEEKASSLEEKKQ